MDKEKFLSEINTYINKKYNKFQEYQKYSIDMLREFHRICESNNITYYLSYGTLLGFIRDGGQILWDYDIDVQVPYKEKDRLVAAMKSDLNNEYYIHCPEVNNKCRHFMMRLSKVGYNSSALHVDVFYLIGAPSDEFEYSKFAKKVKFISHARYYKLVNAKEESMGKKSTYIRMILNKIKYFIIPVKFLNQIFYSLSVKYDYDNSQFYMVAGSNKRYHKELYENRKLMQFSYDEYYIPSGYKEILKINYDNYKDYPTIEARYNEFMNSINRLEYFKRLYKKI